MRRRQPLPRIWLMTDERIGDLNAAIRALPRGSGVVFRHHATPARARRCVFDDVRRLARRRRLLLLLADTPITARSWGADGAHHRSLLRSIGWRSVAVHDPRELRTAQAVDADAIFVSPVLATGTHPGARPLGPARTGLLIASQRHRTMALGGMNAVSARRIRALRLHGWAAIDGLTP